MNQHLFWCQVAICCLFELVFWKTEDGRPE